MDILKAARLGDLSALAAGCNNLASLQILIAAKVDLNVKMITGNTALSLALENKCSEAAALLKKAGAK